MCCTVDSLSQGMEFCRTKVKQMSVLAVDTSHGKVWKETVSLHTILCAKTPKYKRYVVFK